MALWRAAQKTWTSQWALKLDKLSTWWAGRRKACPAERDFYVGLHGHVGERHGLKLQRTWQEGAAG